MKTKNVSGEIKTKSLLRDLLATGVLQGGSRKYNLDGLKYATAIRITLFRNGYIDMYNRLVKPFDVDEAYSLIAKYSTNNKYEQNINTEYNEEIRLSMYSDTQLKYELTKRGWSITGTRTETL